MLLETIRGMIEDKQKARGLSFDYAAQQVRDIIVEFDPTNATLVDQVVQEHNEEAAEALKLSETSTAFARNKIRRNWYTPQVRPGGVWETLRESMSQSSLVSALDSIDTSSNSIVTHLAEPHVADNKRRGLVVGNVQSGKTANYAAVIAKAIDEGYRFIIVLSGVHSNLRQQTQRRLERDLGASDNDQFWYRLTSENGDIGREFIQNASAVVGKDLRVIAVVKKNSHRLENLYDFLRAIDPATKARTPILIIDDESDQATPDASAVGSDSPTAINQRMLDIWGQVGNGTYVGYTATPFANVFIDPDSPDNLYPADFISVMPTPANYFGAERLFGLTDGSRDTPDVVRRINNSELVHLAPRAGKNAPPFTPRVTESLDRAVRWFIIAAAVRRLRGQSNKHSTMLIHTTHKVQPHFLLQEALIKHLAPMKERALDGDVREFHEVFMSEMNRAAGLVTEDWPAATWPIVEKEIPNVLRTLRVAVDNGSADPDERLNYSSAGPQTVIVIGGGTLSRGLTLEGLFVSFFTRTSQTYDTLLQMGRWFGYRVGYEDLQRIWVSSGLDSDYSFLASVEADLRIEIERLTAAGQTPKQIGIRVQEHPGRLQITSKNKMKHTGRVTVDFEGYRLQTTRFDVSDESILSTNAHLVEELIESLEPAKDSSTGRSVLFPDAPSESVLRFLSEFTVYKDYQQLVEGAVRWTAEKLPERHWNVVLASGSGVEEVSIAGVSVQTVSRAPLDNKGAEEDATIDIRALMSGGDLSLDLSLSGKITAPGSKPMNNKDQLIRRAHKDGAGGLGLLVIYPISRHSKAQEGSKVRTSMDSALKAINPHLLKDGVPPLFGIGFVTPFDVDNQLEEKGTFVAVTPTHVDEVEDLELHGGPIVDSEQDFDGDRR